MEAVSKHLTLLKEAGLVADRKVGRETRFRLNAAPLKEIEDRVGFYGSYRNANMARCGWFEKFEQVLQRKSV